MFKEDPAEVYYGYGWSRRYTEILEICITKSDLKVAPTGVYGPHDDFNPSTSHVIPALIRAIDKENPYVVGEVKRLEIFYMLEIWFKVVYYY